MNEVTLTSEKTSKPEINNELSDIPKSKEIYNGDINDAVITVQKITGYEITPAWWLEHVGNDGSTEEILERFDSAFEEFVHEQIVGISIDEQDIKSDSNEQAALREADEEYEKFKERFQNEPGYDQLSNDFLEALKNHLMNKYFSDEVTQHAETEISEAPYGIEVEIADEYTQEEIQQLTNATKEALTTVDEFLNGKTSVVFNGLSIRIGENVAAGGGEAISDENTVALNGRAMLLSLSQMREVAGYRSEELAGGTIADETIGGALRYTLVHEMGHILDELTELGKKKHRVAAAESPTEYGREPDEWNSEKDHEAFAEGFAHMIYKMPVSEIMKLAVQDTIEARLAQSKLHTK